MSFEYFIGRRYLRSKQRQAFISLITFLSTAGVTVGVMALIVVIAVMAGFEADLKSRILGGQAHIIVLKHGGAITAYRDLTEKIKATEGVKAASPFVYTQVMLRSSSGVSGAVLRGIDPKTAGQVIPSLDREAIQGKKITEEGGGMPTALPGIIVGRELARNLGVVLGETIQLISPTGMISPIGHIPSTRKFRVNGFFESGMYEYDGTFVYVDIQEAQRMLRMGDSVTGIEVRVDDVYEAGKIGRDIVEKIGFPFWVRDWMQINRNLFSALKLEKRVMFIILTLIILVAAFNIASTLIMMVMERTKDIAILKAMGATNRSIARIFVFKGMVIGIIGTAIGVCLGFILCTILQHYDIVELTGDVYYFTTTLPVRLETFDVLIISLSAIVICFLATLYPARQAARLNPVEAIRYG